jgi:hypothetical protein
VDRHRFDAHPDPDKIFHSDADPDPDPDSRASFTHAGNIFMTSIHSSASQHFFILLVSVISAIFSKFCIINRNLLKKKYNFASLLIGIRIRNWLRTDRPWIPIQIRQNDAVAQTGSGSQHCCW